MEALSSTKIFVRISLDVDQTGMRTIFVFRVLEELDPLVWSKDMPKMPCHHWSWRYDCFHFVRLGRTRHGALEEIG